MMLGTHIQQPEEVKDYDIDYSDWLTSGDNVESVDVAVNQAGLVAGPVYINDPFVKIWVSGGVSGITYKVTVTTTTADGRVKQDEFKIKVKDY